MVSNLSISTHSSFLLMEMKWHFVDVRKELVYRCVMPKMFSGCRVKGELNTSSTVKLLSAEAVMDSICPLTSMMMLSQGESASTMVLLASSFMKPNLVWATSSVMSFCIIPRNSGNSCSL